MRERDEETTKEQRAFYCSKCNVRLDAYLAFVYFDHPFGVINLLSQLDIRNGDEERCAKVDIVVIFYCSSTSTYRSVQAAFAVRPNSSNAPRNSLVKCTTSPGEKSVDR